jgi:hypothetical protein
MFEHQKYVARDIHPPLVAIATFILISLAPSLAHACAAVVGFLTLARAPCSRREQVARRLWNTTT